MHTTLQAHSEGALWHVVWDEAVPQTSSVLYLVRLYEAVTKLECCRSIRNSSVSFFLFFSISFNLSVRTRRGQGSHIFVFLPTSLFSYPLMICSCISLTPELYCETVDSPEGSLLLLSNSKVNGPAWLRLTIVCSQRCSRSVKKKALCFLNTNLCFSYHLHLCLAFQALKCLKKGILKLHPQIL